MITGKEIGIDYKVEETKVICKDEKNTPPLSNKTTIFRMRLYKDFTKS
jgi:hypothetical protein